MTDFLAHETAYRGNANVIENRASKQIKILGAGALGSFVTELLARQGYTGLTVVDFDRVERDNFGTQNFGATDVGKTKASQLVHNITRKLGVHLASVNKKVTSVNINGIVGGADLVVDLFDNVESRRLVRDTCKGRIPCLHAGLSSIGYFEVLWNEGYLIPEKDNNPENAPCDYPLAANLVFLCVGALAEVMNRYFDEGKKYSAEFWLNSMKMEFTEKEFTENDKKTSAV